MHTANDPQLHDSPLGKSTVYYDQYRPDLLFPIARANNRDTIDIQAPNLPFVGCDIWKGYGFSWLDLNGIPQARKIKISIDCASPNLIESKSFKLYLYSFANTKFADAAAVGKTITDDVVKAINHPGVKVELQSLVQPSIIHGGFSGVCLDNLNVPCTDYQVNPAYLRSSGAVVSEALCSNLLKSNCLVTGHPDWGSIYISYTGKQIDHAGLLQYIVSFRDHQGFHEHCVERIFTDILRICVPTALLVQACYTRRGGLDINPVRSLTRSEIIDMRLFRQ